MGFFSHHVTIDNLAAGGTAIDHVINNSGLDLSNCVVVSPDAGGVVRAKLF